VTLADGPAPARTAETWLARILARWPTSRRRRIATSLALVAILVATIVASSRLLRLLYQELDILAYAGLFAACWVGAGGALVPIPGVRPISWFMIVQQGAALDPVVVALVAASAMALGQTSYFLAARAARRRALGHAVAPPEIIAASGADPGSSGGDPAVGGDPGVGGDPRPDPGTDPTADNAARPAGRRAQRMDAARRRATRQVQTHGVATVFAVCALPTPLTTLTTTAAAAAGMGYLRYIPAAFAGYLVLSSVLVLFGQGLGNLVQSLVPFR
jgi:membrane protein DedA with SNARE-associated domain